uniref:Opioid growth factor receptor n=1 Tax=Rattus norvegicus TaxID=10116 RepID=OGFR_RAT|nr:RecName: Full=Opioid growth factor receptor; Short=OGFr; AltName: Full=Zeta-type opioid receptor [Rattus norvegicus]AAF25002.1 opioid growth factor receptor [Rattus norvegicus]
MDDPDCDSTWEEESEEDGEDGQADDTTDEDTGDDDGDAEEARPSLFQSRMTGYRNWRAMQDMQRYRHNYPDLTDQDCNGDMCNLSFYKNEICFQPNGALIEDILQNWKDNYDLLEENHSYIQWLFPLREPGVNWHAKPLTLKEVEAFKSSKEVRERLVRAYELMLGFYGFHLEDRGTGAVCRAQNFQPRFHNLNSHSHNNLRITRILKSLGELGLEHYQAPLVRFFLEETLVQHKLPSVRQSALDYFLFAVRCRHQRRELVYFAWEHFKPRREFVWGPRDKLRRFKPQTIPQPLTGPGQADKDEGSRDPSQEAGTQGRTCGSGRDLSGDSGTAEDPSLLNTKPSDGGTLDGNQRDEAKSLSPKESKKRKLEGNRQEQVPGEADPQGVSEVEKIALNLEECALSPISQEPREAEPPCPVARVANEVRKRRKVEEGAEGDGVVSNTQMQASALPPTPSECPEAQKDGNGPEDSNSQVGAEDSKSQVGPEDPNSQVGLEDPNSQVGPEDPNSQVGPEDPNSQVGPEDPNSQVGPEDPNSQVVGPEQAASKSPVEDPDSDTMGTSVDESEELARIEASAEPPKP